ncbi:LysR family transcriptional regulator [Croceicoccus naphthovorans]|uniref:Uncharacterized protein n=1 Tax=Croceicoccus naphthovorans TaxID=1348774 RepID=A0A0G3XJ26_9SPHN|nr:LysR family transcriptional regulator [Croceicoccus naphthovorans]AKM10383.1 hypothetical protein AB433_11115 [Croceicoccus naphthovorans]MBB3990079.1 DNA-binding transcriptional LysR family regulator [Croceicoccus naphthovorans]
MIERYLIRYFIAVVDRGSFSRAAAACNVSQPTLSAGIAKLERLVGAPLFERSNRRVELTRAGASFVEHARAIERGFAAAEQVAQESGPAQLLRIGIASTFPSALIGAGVAAMRKADASARIELLDGRMRDLMQQLDRGRLDAVIGPVAQTQEVQRDLGVEDYLMALPASHALASRDDVAPADLAGEAMLVRRNCEALSDTSRFFTAHGVRPFMAARTTDDERAMAMVAAGLAITVAPRCFARDGIAMVRLEGFDPERRIGLISDADAMARIGASPVLRALCDTIADWLTR